MSPRNLSSTQFVRDLLSNKRQQSISVALAIAVALGVLFLLSTLALPVLNPGAKGTTDFLQYWSAFQLTIAGKNPYDPWAMFELQQQLGSPFPYAIMMWNPPWVLPLMAPLLLLPFAQAAFLWLMTNLLLIGASAILLCRTFLPTKKFLAPAVLSLCFYPLWETVLIGQISLVLLFSLSLSLFYFKRSQYLISGIFLSALSIKPHLLYLLAIALCYWVLQKKRWDFLQGIAIGLAVLCASTAVISVDVFQQWLQSASGLPEGAPAISLTEWRGTSLPSLARFLLSGDGSLPATWPMWAIPLASAAGLVVWLLRKSGEEFDPLASLCPLLCLSLATAPYGWMYDQALLLPVQVILLATVWSKGRTGYPIIAGLLLIQLAMLGLAVINYGQDAFFWLPLALLGLWGYQRMGKN